MCGIAGIIDWSGRPVEVETVRAMLHAQAHRGPDGVGMGILPGRPSVGLGVCRLAIVDRDGGEQPMSDSAGEYRALRTWIAFNGEVYNYRELRAELRSLGHDFRTDSDTEVVLQAYAAWGLDFAARLEGMFAVIIWDAVLKRLVLARDQFGIKPLYWSQDMLGRVYVASEIKALLAAGVTARPDPTSVVEYFTLQNMLGTRTMFSGVQLVAPGHVGVIDAYGCQEWRQYADLRFAPVERSEGLDEQAECLLARLYAAVERQSRSERRVGAFLSGGLDSPLIARFASRAHATPLTCYTASYDPPELALDETEAATRLAGTIGAEHHLVRITPEMLLARLPATIWHLDEPRVGPSVQNDLVAQAAAQDGVTVMLSGAGADELFGGYPWRHNPASRHAGNHAAFVRWYTERWTRGVKPAEYGRFFAGDVLKAAHDHNPRRAVSNVLEPARDWHPLHRALYFDAQTFLAGLLIVEDKLTAAHGLETRVPYLDPLVTSYAETLTPWMAGGQDGKRLLRHAARAVLPPRNLVGKTGFVPPDWWRVHLAGAVRELLLSSRTLERGLLQPEAITRVVREHQDGLSSHARLLWSLLSFETWCRLYLDGDVVPS